jgi:hypothetical protein
MSNSISDHTNLLVFDLKIVKYWQCESLATTPCGCSLAHSEFVESDMSVVSCSSVVLDVGEGGAETAYTFLVLLFRRFLIGFNVALIIFVSPLRVRPARTRKDEEDGEVSWSCNATRLASSGEITLHLGTERGRCTLAGKSSLS